MGIAAEIGAKSFSYNLKSEFAGFIIRIMSTVYPADIDFDLYLCGFEGLTR